MENNSQNNILDSYESTENALLDSFKAAALKVTTLYKDSLIQNRKAYASGYQQALQDLYGFLLSVQPENGTVPVQEVLAFAREKHNQLNMEMNGNSSGSSNPSPTAAATSTQNTPPALRSTTTSTNTPTDVNTTTTNALEEQQQQKSMLAQQSQAHQQQHVHGNPFQIDPNTQFTFTQDLPNLAQQQQQYRSVDGLWGQATDFGNSHEYAVKRRMLPSELTFMGRSVNVDAYDQPPVKRNRLRREEQVQLHQQHMLQQQQLQQQLQLQQEQQQQQQFLLLQQQQQQQGHQGQQQQGQSALFHPPS